MESRLTCGSILKPLPTVVGGNFPIFVIMIPQESESEQVAQLMKTDPKILGISIKFPIEES